MSTINRLMQYGFLGGYVVQREWSNIYNACIMPIPSALQQVADAFTHSDEHFALYVTNAYQGVLKRTPAASEVAAWVQEMHRGLSDEAVAAGFVGSPEYYLRAGGTDKAWVDHVYQVLLARDADAGGEAGWLHALASGTDRGTIALRIATSQERRSLLVARAYPAFLGRTASAPEIASWVNAMDHGLTDEQLITAFAASAESYYRNHSTSGEWLNFAYGTILGRKPDDAGFKAWLMVLDNVP
jgi:hypothetical protein